MLFPKMPDSLIADYIQPQTQVNDDVLMMSQSNFIFPWTSEVEIFEYLLLLLKKSSIKKIFYNFFYFTN